MYIYISIIYIIYICIYKLVHCAPPPPPLSTPLMVGNGGPRTGCQIHRVTKYSGFQNACVRFSFPVFRQNNFNIQIGLNAEFSTSATGCSIRVDRAMKISLFFMCMMDSK